jgi:hypothetical protein
MLAGDQRDRRALVAARQLPFRRRAIAPPAATRAASVAPTVSSPATSRRRHSERDPGPSDRPPQFSAGPQSTARRPPRVPAFHTGDQWRLPTLPQQAHPSNRILDPPPCTCRICQQVTGPRSGPPSPRCARGSAPSPCSPPHCAFRRRKSTATRVSDRMTQRINSAVRRCLIAAIRATRARRPAAVGPMRCSFRRIYASVATATRSFPLVPGHHAPDRAHRNATTRP